MKKKPFRRGKAAPHITAAKPENQLFVQSLATDQRIESVGLFLASFAGMKGIAGTSGTVDEKGKPLEKQKIAVS